MGISEVWLSKEIGDKLLYNFKSLWATMGETSVQRVKSQF